MNFENFIKNCNELYLNELLPKLLEENKNLSKNSDNPIGVALGICLKSANKISLTHLENYHKWLSENFELTPKN